MPKIMNVDYEAIPKNAQQMRAYGTQLNGQMTTAYKSIGDMHNYWYGKRYNELVKLFNQLIPKINDMLTLVVTDIPYTLETVANNYSQADKGQNVTTAKKETPKKITNLTIPNDVGMKFLTSDVQSTQNSVDKNFTNAISQMNNIETEYKKVNWQSEASGAFEAKFAKLKQDIIDSFEDIQGQFKSLMEQTQQDIEATEQANTVQ